MKPFFTNILPVWIIKKLNLNKKNKVEESSDKFPIKRPRVYIDLDDDFDNNNKHNNN